MRHGSSCGCPDCEDFHPERFENVEGPVPAPATAPPSTWKPKKGDIVRAVRTTDYFHEGEKYTVAQGPKKGMSGIRVFGSTGIPVLTSIDVFVPDSPPAPATPEAPPSNLTHRWNVEKADEGIRLCRGDHDRSQDCDWEYFRPADSPAGTRLGWNFEHTLLNTLKDVATGHYSPECAAEMIIKDVAEAKAAGTQEEKS